VHPHALPSERRSSLGMPLPPTAFGEAERDWRMLTQAKLSVLTKGRTFLH